MSKIRKDIGVTIRFDDVDYSYEETIYLYQRFFEALAGMAKTNIPKNFAESIFPREFFEEKRP